MPAQTFQDHLDRALHTAPQPSQRRSVLDLDDGSWPLAQLRGNEPPAPPSAVASPEGPRRRPSLPVTRPTVSAQPPQRDQTRVVGWSPYQRRALDAFRMLGARLPNEPSRGQVREAFGTLARRLHPDTGGMAADVSALESLVRAWSALRAGPRGGAASAFRSLY